LLSCRYDRGARSACYQSVNALDSAWDSHCNRSMRSVVFLIKYLVREAVQGNAFGSKIGSESRSRPFAGRQQMPAARLEWSRGNLKFRGGTLRHQGEKFAPDLLRDGTGIHDDIVHAG
jgi:hypothetical protein